MAAILNSITVPACTHTCYPILYQGASHANEIVAALSHRVIQSCLLPCDVFIQMCTWPPTEAWRKQNVLVAPSVVQDLCPLRSDLLFYYKNSCIVAWLHLAGFVCCSLKKQARWFRWNSTWQSRCKSLTMQKQSPKLPWVLLPWDEVLLPDEAAKKRTRNVDGTEVVKLLCKRLPFDGFAMDDHDHQ